MVVVIGDNVARAFGLVGLGSFIRFRSGISDPRDAAVMFVMIGIGMACGLGLPLMAAPHAVHFVLLTLFDATNKNRRKRSSVVILTQRTLAQCAPSPRCFLTRASSSSRVRKAELGKDSGKLMVELDLRGTMDASTIRQICRPTACQG